MSTEPEHPIRHIVINDVPYAVPLPVERHFKLLHDRLAALTRRARCGDRPEQDGAA